MSQRRPYPETRKPFVWPTLGVRTWQPPALSFFGGECSASGDVGQTHACPVGVYRIRGYVTGCDCGCHDERRVRLMSGPQVKKRKR
ncbi:hypothetical protein ABH940_001700 [Streptacidiphilus sp. BW17]